MGKEQEKEKRLMIKAVTKQNIDINTGTII